MSGANAFGIFLVLSSALCASGQVTKGALQGVVADAGGAPLAGAQVRYRRIPRTMPAPHNQLVAAPGELLAQSSLLTDSGGNFSAPSLPTGDYLLCVNVSFGAYLDPCRWATALRVTVSANGVTKQNIALRKGVFLKVRMNDPQALLPRTQDGPTTAGKLIVGVYFANGAFIGIGNTSMDANGKDYQMAIPTGTPLKLRLFSSDVALTDSEGKAVNNSGTQIAFEAVSNQDQIFVFAVSKPAVKSQ